MKALNTKLFGISADSVKSHEKFAEKYDLALTLLADTNKEAVSLYDVKQFIILIKRVSFLIDPTGKIAKVYENVKPKDHAAEVLNDLKKFNDKSPDEEKTGI